MQSASTLLLEGKGDTRDDAAAPDSLGVEELQVTLISLAEHNRVLVELLQRGHQTKGQCRSNVTVEGVRYLVAPPPAEPSLKDVLASKLLGCVLLAEHQTGIGNNHAVFIEVIVIILRKRGLSHGFVHGLFAHEYSHPFLNLEVLTTERSCR